MLFCLGLPCVHSWQPPRENTHARLQDATARYLQGRSSQLTTAIRVAPSKAQAIPSFPPGQGGLLNTWLIPPQIPYGTGVDPQFGRCGRGCGARVQQSSGGRAPSVPCASGMSCFARHRTKPRVRAVDIAFPSVRCPVVVVALSLHFFALRDRCLHAVGRRRKEVPAGDRRRAGGHQRTRSGASAVLFLHGQRRLVSRGRQLLRQAGMYRMEGVGAGGMQTAVGCVFSLFEFGRCSWWLTATPAQASRRACWFCRPRLHATSPFSRF